jgi:hypothetical protein
MHFSAPVRRGEKAGNTLRNLTTSEEEAFAQVQQSSIQLEQEKTPLDYSCQKVLEAFAGI